MRTAVYFKAVYLRPCICGRVFADGYLRTDICGRVSADAGCFDCAHGAIRRPAPAHPLTHAPAATLWCTLGQCPSNFTSAAVRFYARKTFTSAVVYTAVIGNVRTAAAAQDREKIRTRAALENLPSPAPESARAG